MRSLRSSPQAAGIDAARPARDRALYDAAEFEAYHELGEAAVLAAAKECTPPLTSPVPVGHGSRPTPAQLGNAKGT